MFQTNFFNISRVNKSLWTESGCYRKLEVHRYWQLNANYPVGLSMKLIQLNRVTSNAGLQIYVCTCMKKSPKYTTQQRHVASSVVKSQSINKIKHFHIIKSSETDKADTAVRACNSHKLDPIIHNVPVYHRALYGRPLRFVAAPVNVHRP